MIVVVLVENDGFFLWLLVVDGFEYMIPSIFGRKVRDGIVSSKGKVLHVDLGQMQKLCRRMEQGIAVQTFTSADPTVNVIELFFN